MSWWRRTKVDRQGALLDRFLDLEERRLSHLSDRESKQAELELRRLEVESNHIEARNKAQIELERARAELREKRRTSGRRAALRRWHPEQLSTDKQCPLCINPLYPKPTVQMIQEHNQHEGMAATPASGPETPERGN